MEEFIYNNKERNTTLFFKILHERNLMSMDILQWEGIRIALLCVKAHRHTLYGSDIVDSAPLFEIGQCYLSPFLVHPDRCDRCRYLLNKGEALLPVMLVCSVYELLKSRASKSSAFPGPHIFLLPLYQAFPSGFMLVSGQ